MAQPQLRTPREHHRRVPEYDAGLLASFDQLSPRELLQAWRSLYCKVDALAMAGWTYRDFSWDRVQLYRKDSSEPWSVRLIDFRLAVDIPQPGIEGSDGACTPAFMPTHYAMWGPPPQHLELYEDESAFWIGYLALIRRSTAGRDYLDQFMLDPNLNPRTVGHAKYAMANMHNPSLLKFLTGPSPGRDVDVWQVVRDVRLSVIQKQFTVVAKFIHPIQREGHLEVHGRAFRGVVDELEKAIVRLERLEAVKQRGKCEGVVE